MSNHESVLNFVFNVSICSQSITIGIPPPPHTHTQGVGVVHSLPQSISVPSLPTHNPSTSSHNHHSSGSSLWAADSLKSGEPSNTSKEQVYDMQCALNCNAHCRYHIFRVWNHSVEYSLFMSGRSNEFHFLVLFLSAIFI